MHDFPDKDEVLTHLKKIAQTPLEYRQINTFMKRRTHMSQKAKIALIDERYLPYLLNPTPLGELGDVSGINDLRHAFLDNPNGADAKLVLEIGFGMGQSLVQMAADNPTTNFVGIEVHEPGIGNATFLASKAGLDNLKLINGDAIALLNALPEAHLDGVQLFFPDPWQKKRHHKRRFVTPHRMELLARCLKTGGFFHTATDWEHYAFWMLEVLDNMPQFNNCAGKGQFSPRPSTRPLTKFEQRGINSGHGVWDLLYKKCV